MNEEEKEQFITIIESIKELRLRKSADYGNSWKILGLMGVLMQIMSKSMRIWNLTNKVTYMKDPQNESLRDTLIDLANYSVMGVQLIDLNEIEPKI